MNPAFQFIYWALDIYYIFIFVYIIISLLKAFDVINKYNQYVNRVEKMLGDIVEPVLSRIRKIVPPFGSVDLSPVILLLLISTIQYAMVYYSRQRSSNLIKSNQVLKLDQRRFTSFISKLPLISQSLRWHFESKARRLGRSLVCHRHPYHLKFRKSV